MSLSSLSVEVEISKFLDTWHNLYPVCQNAMFHCKSLLIALIIYGRLFTNLRTAIGHFQILVSEAISFPHYSKRGLSSENMRWIAVIRFSQLRCYISVRENSRIYVQT